MSQWGSFPVQELLVSTASVYFIMLQFCTSNGVLCSGALALALGRVMSLTVKIDLPKCHLKWTPEGGFKQFCKKEISSDKRAIHFLSGRSQNCVLICSLKVVAIKLLFHPLTCRWCSEQIPECVAPSVHLHCPFPLVLVQADIWPPSALYHKISCVCGW